jgi:multiple sugar transport system permease protein
MMNLQAIDRVKKNARRGGTYLVLVAVAIVMVLPVFWLLSSSLKTDSTIMKWPIDILPKTWKWSNFTQVFTLTPFVKVAIRTASLGLYTAFISAFTSAMAGYGFARFRGVKGNKGLFSLIIAMLIIPGIVTLIPQFIVYARLKMVNTYWPWFIGAAGASPYFIFLFRQFFMVFPRELEEAAEMDGCSSLGTFLMIVLPNSLPVIATTLILSFTWTWGDYLMPLIYLQDSKTLLGVTMATAFRDPSGHELKAVSLAATTLYILPMILVFFFGQKYILKGMITSGLKG